MASKKAASKSSVASDAYIGPITRSRSKGITQEQDQGSNVAQSILKQLMESPKTGIFLKENPLYDNSNSTSSKSKKEARPDVMSVMMADISTEAAMVDMERKVNFLMKVMEERDHEITALRDQMWTRETAKSSQTLVVKATDKEKNVVQENQQQQQSVSVASLSVQQLKNMIANSIKAQYRGPLQTSFMYSKSYTKRIDNLRMPLWYQPPKFQQSDEKGNLEQHITHFVETFVEICTQGMHWGLLYILQGIKPRTFEELVTHTHDMELSIASRGTKDLPISKVRKDKETKSAEKVVNSTVKESIVVNMTPLKYYRHARATTGEPADLAAGMLDREKKIELDLEEIAQTNHAAEVAPEDSQEKERLIKEDDEGRGNKAQKNKKKKKTRKLKLLHEEDKDFLRPQRLVTLADFFPTRFLCDHQDENPGVVACHAINSTEEESILLRSLEEEGVSKDLLRFNVNDLLSLPQETKTILINAFLNSATSSLSAPTATYESTLYCMSIDFLDEDLLLGSKLHNRPLYVSGYVREQRVDRILIDNGSTINIMPKSTIRQLGILMDELSNIKLVIQGFNQGSQKVIGMIRLELIIGDLKASALFHVIDSRSTYKLLLGRPRIHGNGVVTSTLHQCFKFCQDGVKKVEVDSNPFSEAKSHFTDVKFCLKNDNSSEVVPVEIPLVNREDNLQLKSLESRKPHKSTGTFHSGKGEASTSTTKSMILMDEKASNSSLLRYVPLSRRQKGESPFVEALQGLKVGNIEVLKESFTTPVTKITKQEIKIDLTEANLPQKWTKDGFDPKAYKLMAKASF
ncbi:ty3-gypsy retrotransposon protein [Cucumis melo var. makuwa]|uniref:Ty3-gypsy retrotransposon protein n=1 Tax=Cucumis melo var. makuwa TaxID=1194695 RepID=A0A5A7VFQ8_CUCMM|nr:ty3-gypsy retrotransposon protein [Cucumis melo var. makuwa]